MDILYKLRKEGIAVEIKDLHIGPTRSDGVFFPHFLNIRIPGVEELTTRVRYRNCVVERYESNQPTRHVLQERCRIFHLEPNSD